MPIPAVRSLSLSPSLSPCSHAPRGAGSSPARMRMRMVGTQVGSAPLLAPKGALSVTRGTAGSRLSCPCPLCHIPGVAEPSPHSLHPQAPSQPLQLPAPGRMRRMKIHSPGGGGSASAAWRRKRRIECLSVPCLCPGPVLFPGLFVDFTGFLQFFSGVSTGFLGVSAGFFLQFLMLFLKAAQATNFFTFPLFPWCHHLPVLPQIPSFSSAVGVVCFFPKPF